MPLSFYPTYQIFLTAAFALLLTAALTPVWIRIQRSQHIGQVVRTDGPEGHQTKQGTPTMGGLLILFAVLAIYLLMASVRGYSPRGFLALWIVLACGLLGLVDDYLMVARARSLGLKARYKLLFTLGIAIIAGYVGIRHAGLSTVIALPLTNLKLDLGWFYLLFLFLVIVATTNSVNLTDGLDGLAAGTVTIVMLAYAGISFRQDQLDLAILSAAIGGACLGFLWYNSFPADMFMGDTGSLALGGAIAAMAVLTKTELLLLLIGGIYVIETLSVIIQVFFFRVFKRRIFKMAPIHHHFEIIGWSETKIMIRFWIVSGLLSGAGFALYFISALRLL